MLPGTENIPRFDSLTFAGPIDGGVSRRVAAGDSIVNAARPRCINRESVDPPHLSYVIYRVDPQHVLHPGYTHPELQD